MRSVVLALFVVQLVWYGSKANDLESLAEQTFEFLLKYCDVGTRKCGPVPQDLQIKNWSFKRGEPSSITAVGKDHEDSVSTLAKRSQPIALGETSKEDVRNDNPDVAEDKDDATTSGTNFTSTTPTSLVIEDNRMRHGSTPTPISLLNRKTKTRDLPPSLTNTSPSEPPYPTCVCHCAPCSPNEVVQDGSSIKKTGTDTDTLETERGPHNHVPSAFDESAGNTAKTNTSSPEQSWQLQAPLVSTRNRYGVSAEPLYGLRSPAQPVGPPKY
ncbi:hypothetical protein RvY_09884-2 [Ramazzottius varieornatus]|uniref:Uncharacterized protein n=1 Tax=Ramazzottius varieornatus TaxID=947166 RepID=A0A1D1VGA1_RAMVA|nr:hypothetical protein RvY_09884-2 [Ramazzottius varieornatus]